MPQIGWWKRTMGKITALISLGLNKRTSDIHTALYRRTGGKLGGKVASIPTLILTTTGRKTGQPRAVPLNYLRVGGNYVVIASNSGKDEPPAWFLNLQTHPQATIQIGKSIIPVEARQATPDEQARLWPKLISKAYNYAEYQKRTSRAIPMVILRTVGIRA